jgi:hypothetical protein
MAHGFELDDTGLPRQAAATWQRTRGVEALCEQNTSKVPPVTDGRTLSSSLVEWGETEDVSSMVG